MRINFKWKILLPVFILFVLFIVVTQYFIYKNTKFLTDYFIESDLEKTIKNFKDEVKLQAQKCLVMASLISSYGVVLDDYQIGDPQLSRDALRQDLDKIIKKLKRDTGINKFKIHFHLPPAISLLRIWRKPGHKDGGDDISSFRKSILQVYRTKRSVSGIEVGRGGLTVRGIAPIIGKAEGSGKIKYFGSVEMMEDLKQIAKNLSTPKAKITIFIKNSELKIARKLKDFPKIGDFTLLNKGNFNILKNRINNSLLTKGLNEKVIKDNMDGTLTAVFSIKDFKGDVVGVASILYNTKEAISLMNSKMWKFVISLTIGLILIIMILYFAISYLMKPLIMTRDMLKEISQGEADLTKKNYC